MKPVFLPVGFAFYLVTVKRIGFQYVCTGYLLLHKMTVKHSDLEQHLFCSQICNLVIIKRPRVRGVWCIYLVPGTMQILWTEKGICLCPWLSGSQESGRSPTQVPAFCFYLVTLLLREVTPQEFLVNLWGAIFNPGSVRVFTSRDFQTRPVRWGREDYNVDKVLGGPSVLDTYRKEFPLSNFIWILKLDFFFF